MTLEQLTMPGTHCIAESIKIPDGTYLKAQPGARLIGGMTVKAAPCGDGLYECDLRAQGIEPAPMVSRGWARGMVASHTEIFINSRPLTISQYPKKGQFLKIAKKEIMGADNPRRLYRELDAGYYYEDEHPKTWAESEDLWVHGYWSADWAPTREHIELLDTEKGFVKTYPPYGEYRFFAGQRFFFYNIREEVTEPGDYCIDYKAGKILFRPFEDTDMETAEILVSLCDKPVFDFCSAHDITIEGFLIEGFRNDAVQICDSSNIVIKNCEIRNIGSRAIVVNRSNSIVVDGCHIHDTADDGVVMNCGNRATLEGSNCVVENCHIHHVAHWDRCYHPPISVSGVGFKVRNNVLHDCPHEAIAFFGNEISITGNEIYRCVLESADAGAVYSGRDYTCRGNEVSRNFFHHIGSGVGYGTMCIYNDDCMSGTKMEENVFFHVERAVFLGGGRDFIVRRNVFIDCHPAIELDGRGQSESKMWRSMVDGTLRQNFYNIAGSGKSGVSEPYASKYPELSQIHAYYNNGEEIPHIKPGAVMTDNILCTEDTIDYTDYCDGGDWEEHDNISVSREELKKYVSAYQYEIIAKEEAEYIKTSYVPI